MKRYLILLILATVTFASCKKDKNNNKTEDGNPVGTWELRHVNNDMGISDYKPGNGKLLQFSQTNMKSYADGKLIFDHQYKITKKDPIKINNTDEVSYQLIWDSDSASINPYFKIANGKLTIYSGILATDGSEETYEKQ